MWKLTKYIRSGWIFLCVALCSKCVTISCGSFPCFYCSVLLALMHSRDPFCSWAEGEKRSPSCPSPDLRRYVMRPLTLKCATQSSVAHNYLFSYYSALTELILLLWRTLQPAENMDRLCSWKSRHQRAGSVCLSCTLWTDHFSFLLLICSTEAFRQAGQLW